MDDQKPIVSDTGKKPEPGITYPRCPFCERHFAMPGVAEPPPRTDGTKPGDPLVTMRLRYDFPDGVVAEVLFCADCRGVIGTQIVGVMPVPKPK